MARMDAEAAAAADSQQRNSHSHSQAAHPTGPAYAAAAGPTPERSANPASRLRLFEEIKQKNLKRGGLRTDARGNVRLRCPWCEHKSNSFVWNAEHHGGCFQCFHCNEKGGWKKLAQQYGLLKRRGTDHRTDAGVFREWQTIALTGLDWRGLARRFAFAKDDAPTPAAVARAATATARTYIAITEVAARAGTTTPAAATRTIAELTGASRHAAARSLVALRRAGLLSQAGLRMSTHWMARTLKDKARRAPIYLVRDPRTVNLLTEFLCKSEPEHCEAVPTPEASTGSILHNSVAWRRGGISHADFAVLAHLEHGPTTQKKLCAATGFSQSTISRSLKKLEGFSLVLRDRRLWVRTPRTLATVVDGPAFDKARAAAKRQRIRHQVERERFDNTQLPAVLEGASKATAAPKKLVMTPYQHQAGPQTHQERAGATNAGKDGRPYAPTRKGFSAATHMRL